MNEVRIYGRALEAPKLNESERGSKWCNLNLDVDGEYYSFLCCQDLAEEVCHNVEKGQKLIVKGRLSAFNNTCNEFGIVYRPSLIADEVYYVA